MTALFYVLNGAWWGWSLRLLDALYVGACCLFAGRLARAWCGPSAGWLAAFAMAFFLAFYLPSAAIAFAADALLLLPHLAAVYLAVTKRPVWAGIVCGIGFTGNVKALFVLAACALFCDSLGALIAGFLLASAVALMLLLALGAWPGYMEQVWLWGLRYAAGSPVENPLATGVTRTTHWLGFHAALVAGTVIYFKYSDRRRRLAVWVALSLASVALGSRFAPHYYVQLLPPLCVATACGFALAYRARPRLALPVAVVALAIPLLRFGPRYITVALSAIAGKPTGWSDAALDEDSQAVANFINARKQVRDTLLVWGYRPDMYVFTRLIAPGLFWDSQPLTGVAADRHLRATTAIYSGPALPNRQMLIRTQPSWIVDGLGLLNPKLRPQSFSEVAQWMGDYELASRTRLSLVYRRKQPSRSIPP